MTLVAVLLITSNLCIPVKGTLGGNAVMSCYGEEFHHAIQNFLLRFI